MRDLEKQGVLLPRKARGRMNLSSPVNRLASGAVLLLGILACVLMAVGAGTAVTWAGTVLFVLFLFLFALESNNRIERQSQECEKLLTRARETDRTPEQG